MKSVASCLPEDCTKKITNYSTRKTVVGKLEAGQPRHKIIQVTGHARESSLDDYDEITEDERRQLCHIASGYVAPKSSSSSVNSVQACTSTSTASYSMESPQPADTLPECVTKENIPTNPPGILPFYMPTQSMTMATKHLQQAPLQVFNQCVFNNAFSHSSRPKPRKKRVIIDPDSD